MTPLETILLIIMAFLPPVIYAIWIRNTEKYNREKWWPIFLCFLWGATIAVVAAIILELVLHFSLATSFSDRNVYNLVAVIIIAPFAEELINIQDVEKMIKAADHPRDKAFVSLLYEGGFRIEELLTLYIKNVSLDEYGAKLMVRQGKTGMRPVRIVASAPYLSSWLENHPFGDNPEAPLWVGIGTRNKNKMFCYENARSLIRKITKKANIKKRIHPHLFRHSRVTYFSKKKFTHEQLCQYFGWVEGSEMPSQYTHLAARDIEDEILNLNGIKIENEENKHEFIPKKCHRCKKMNPPVSKFCVGCGIPLDSETVMKIDEKREEMDNIMMTLLKDLLKDPEIQARIENKLRQIGAET